MGDTKISCAEDLSELEEHVQKGDSMKVTVVRDGEELVLDMTI